MSLPNPETVVTEERLNEFYTELLPYLGGRADAGFTPVGTIIAVMGNSAPTNYLICNGQTVNIADYPELAAYFKEQFGSANYFGGDGTTTFAICDLRGEFLRGTGSNGHSGQGNGAAVGTHQNSTQIPSVLYDGGASGEQPYLNFPIGDNGTASRVLGYVNPDALFNNPNGDKRTWWNASSISSKDTYTEKANGMYSTRPTNTSVLYCIAVKNIYMGSGGGSGADAALESDVTTNLAVGAIASGTTLAQGMTFTEFVQKLTITEIAPTTTFSASGSGVKEVGTSVTPTLTLTITGAGTGTPTAIKFYDGSTLLDTQSYVSGTNTYTYTMSAVTTTRTVKGVLEYKKSDNTTATIEKSATYTFVMASYYGAVTTAPTDKAGIIALTKNVKNTKAQTATFTLSNQRSCYCYPASFGNLTSIKDANNFEYLSSYTKTNVTVDDVSYNVYTLTDPVTASGFKQVYA